MDIQTEVQKIHSQFGTTEMANYQIQKLFDKLILEHTLSIVEKVVGEEKKRFFIPTKQTRALDRLLNRVKTNKGE